MGSRIELHLGNYRLTSLLGQGGFAEVYLGEHIYLKTQAAIKVLHTRLAKAEDMKSFLKEAQTVAHLIHPHIVRIFDFGVDQQTPFLVMDYAPNGTLRQLHKLGEPLPLPTVVSYVKQIAEALQYAHSEKLIHRDVKPENMLVSQHHNILLSDFGIALVAQSSRFQSTQDVVGTVAYMSPEQIQGKPRPASDQYSLAIVAYEWLSGTRPFNGSFTELCAQHMFAPVPPLRAHMPALPPEVEQVINTALAKDPKERFGSILAFATALAQASESNLSSQEHLRPSTPSTIPDTLRPQAESTPSPVQPEAVINVQPQEQSPGSHLPAWLRAEIRNQPPAPPAPVLSPAAPEKSAHDKEIAQLREELARHRKEMARYQQQISQMKSVAKPEGRGGCLTAWLIMQMIALTVSVISSCALAGENGPGIFALASVGAIVGGISIGGLWNLRKWGYYMQMTMGSLAIGIALITVCLNSASPDHTILSISIGQVVGTCIAMGLLYWMVHQHWEVFDAQ